MSEQNQKQLGKTLWSIATNQLWGAMNPDDFRDYMLSLLFLRYLSDNYEAAAEKELGKDYPTVEPDSSLIPLEVWYAANADDVPAFEKQMRRKVHYVIQPLHLWSSIANMARKRQNQLSEAHIAKIIDTYKNRTEEARYSRPVEMSEIEKNDFNLNISRYISTAVAEAEIDLSATHAELVKIESDIAKAKAKHNAFLKELGLNPLP